MGAVPLFVVKALAEVREGGEVNMFDRQGVTALVSSERAAEWLDKASNTEYMEALNEMGEYISVPHGTAPFELPDEPFDF